MKEIKKISYELKEKYSEFDYLNTENSIRYRSIIEFMYEELQRKEFLYSNDIFNYLKAFYEFNDYTLDDLGRDLEVLVSKRNVLQFKNDYSTIKNLEEIKKKRYRYQLSEKTRMIEEFLLEKFNEINSITIILDPTLLIRLKEELERFCENPQKILGRSDKEILQWWNSIIRGFDELSRTYREFTMENNSFENEISLEADDFIKRKVKLKEYLQDFISILLREGDNIKELLLTFKEMEEFGEMIERVKSEEYEIGNSQKKIDLEKINKRVENKKKKLYRWFIGENEESEVEILRRNTIRLINKITNLAEKYIRRRRVVYSRKESYRKMATMFSNLENIQEGHKLSSLLFGIQEFKHFRGEYRGESLYLEVRKISRKKGKERRVVVKDNKLFIQNRLKELGIKEEKEKNILLKYMIDSTIFLEKLPKLTSYTKKLILEIIRKGLSNPKKTVESIVILEDKMFKEYNFVEYHNFRYKLLIPEDKKDTTIIESEDGNLLIPSMIIKFEVISNDGSR